MYYCRPSSNATEAGWLWTAGAFNQCVFDSVVAGLQALIMIVCGGSELRSYYRYSTRVDSLMLGRPPLLYVVQLSLSALLAAVNLSRGVVTAVDEELYGYILLHSLVGLLVWTTSAVIIYVERNYDLPTMPRGRHSPYLLLFWLLAFVIDTLYLVNVAGTNWFFALRNDVDVVMLALFCVQWVSEMLTLVLGARAPGILSNLQRSQFIYRPIGGASTSSESDEPAISDKYGSFSSCIGSALELSTGSTFTASMEQLKADIRSQELIREYERLPRQSATATTNAARTRDNMIRNRYTNVLPYDHNRVLLKSRDNDYINASWITMCIPDLDTTNIYIATQGALQSTIKDLWELIWQERTPVIVMLTDCLEPQPHTNTRVQKCVQYWPELNDTLELGELLISCNHSYTPRNKSYTIRDLFIVHTRTGEEHTVIHCQMHDWPDHGTPKSVRKLLNFWRAVRSKTPMRRAVPNSSQTLSPPVLVHCSAGVGRTGAYILLETLNSYIDAEAPVRPIDVLASMREQRMAMVQTDEQMLTACRAALQYYDEKRHR